MSILKVARMGHPVLRQTAEPVDQETVRSAAFQKLIDDMIDTMREYQGIGLAAPQVHEGIRLFVAGIETGRNELRIVPFINPVVEPVGVRTSEDWEGCLSIPDLRGLVERAEEVRVEALDRRGETFEVVLGGYPARVIQHEADHLDGVLFLDRMTSFESLTFLEEYGRYWAEKD